LKITVKHTTILTNTIFARSVEINSGSGFILWDFMMSRNSSREVQRSRKGGNADAVHRAFDKRGEGEMPFVIVVRADGATWDGKEWVK
jgi:hypothetical protein